VACIPENGEENLEFLIAVARYQKLKYLFLRRIHGHHIMKKFMREGARNEIYIPGSIKKAFRFDGTVFAFDRIQKIAEENLRFVA